MRFYTYLFFDATTKQLWEESYPCEDDGYAVSLARVLMQPGGVVVEIREGSAALR